MAAPNESPKVVSPESLVEAVFANSDDGLVTYDLEYRYTLWNPTMERLTGVPASDVLGQNVLAKFPHLVTIGVDVLLRRALAGETVGGDNYEAKGPDGERRYFDRRVSPLRDASGTIVGGLVRVRDVTARRVAELTLQEREGLFRSVVENTTDAIGIVDASGRLHYANPALVRIGGYTEAELRGRSVLELVHPDDLAAAAEGMARMAEIGAVAPNEARWRRKDGSWRTLEGHSRSFLDRDGQLKIVLHARDVTEARVAREAVERAEAELDESRERLRASEKLEAIGRLVGGVAHDINNLLTVILSCADLLGRGAPSSSSSQDYLSEIVRASERGAALTRQLLTFSRKQPAQMRVLDVNTVVLELQTMLKRLIGERVELVASLGDSLCIQADPAKIEQVILNLVLNARDALGDHCGKIVIETSEIRIREPQDSIAPGRYVALRVEDDGVGMSDDVKKHLFEPFFTTKARGKGTGLGLATVYGIVKRSGGHVKARSAVGEGTSFEVLFPLVDDVADPRPVSMPAARPRGHETILLVEDEPPLRRLVHEVLAESGYAVLEAASGEEAVQVLDERGARGEAIDLVAMSSCPA